MIKCDFLSVTSFAKLLTDITKIACKNGKQFVAQIIDSLTMRLLPLECMLTSKECGELTQRNSVENMVNHAKTQIFKKNALVNTKVMRSEWNLSYVDWFRASVEFGAVLTLTRLEQDAFRLWLPRLKF